MAQTPRLPLCPLALGAVTLEPAAARYLMRVLRLGVGDRFEAFDPRTGARAEGSIVAFDRAVVQVQLQAIDSPRASDAPVVLIQGYPKGDKLSGVVRDATELGATLIVPAICARSIARPDDAKLAARAQRLSAIAAEAARQCGRARAPELLAPMPWDDALELAAALGARGLVAFERAQAPIGDAMLALARDEAARARGVAIAIGPEGGLTDDEVEHARARGFSICSLGATILRTETAATAALAAYFVIAASSKRE